MPKKPKKKGSLRRKFTAIFLLLSFTLLNTSHQVFAGHLGGVPPNALPKAGPEPDDILTSFLRPAQADGHADAPLIPAALGSVEEVFKPAAPSSSDRLVIYLQDAHAHYDSQSNIRRMIRYFQEKFGLSLILLEGGEGKLDSLFFKSFPEKELKEKILDGYLRNGELSGGEAAAILEGKQEAAFYGIETQALYQENKRAFLEAIGEEEKISRLLDQAEAELESQAERLFTLPALTFHQQQRAFQKESLDIIPYTESLAAFFPAALRGSFKSDFPELQKILDAASRAERLEQNYFDIAMGRLIEDFKRSVLTNLPKKKRMEMGERIQEYQTRRSSAGTLVRQIREICKETQCPRIPALLEPAVRQAQTLSSLQGTQLFKELETLEAKLRERLPQSRKERLLLEDFHRLERLKRLGKLELSRGDWEALKGITASDLAGLPLSDSLNALFASHRKFYELAWKRDAALFGNLNRMMDRKSAKVALLVTGGFHAQGITRRLRESRTPFILLTPKISQREGRDHYLNVMRGQASYMRYFQGSLWDALARDYAAKLLGEAEGGRWKVEGKVNPFDLRPSTFHLLKRWRDRIIQNLIAEGRITEANSYTKYVDALAQALRKESASEAETAGRSPLRNISSNALRMKIEKELDSFFSAYFDRLKGIADRKIEIFSRGLKEIWETGKITPQSVNHLFRLPDAVSLSSLHPDLALIPGRTYFRPQAEPGLGRNRIRVRSEVRAPELSADKRSRGYSAGKLMTLIEVLRGKISREAYEALGGNNFQGILDLAKQKKPGAFSSLKRVLFKAALRNLAANQAPQVRAILELTKNAMEWSAKKAGKPYYRIGHHGQGALQILGELEQEEDYAVVESKVAEGSGVRFFLWNDPAEGYQIYYEFADAILPGVETGVKIQVVKKLSREAQEARRDILREKLRINTLGAAVLNGERINVPEAYQETFPPGIGKVDPDVSPVFISVTENGYTVQDSGPGMDIKGIFENYLLPYEGANGELSKKEPPKNARRFTDPTLSTVTRAAASNNGFGIEAHTNREDPRLNLVKKIDVDFLRMDAPASWDLVEYDKESTIPQMKAIIDQLTTDPAEQVAGRFAQINSLAILIRRGAAEAGQTPENPGAAKELIQYLRVRTQWFIEEKRKMEQRKKEEEREEIILVPNRIHVPGMPYGAAIFDAAKFTPLDPELFDFELQAFAAAARLQPLEGAPRNALLENIAGLENVPVFIADWKLQEKTGWAAAWTVVGGQPVIFVDPSLYQSLSQENIPLFQGLLGGFAEEIHGLKKPPPADPEKAEPKKEKRGNPVLEFLKWNLKKIALALAGLSLLVVLIYGILTYSSIISSPLHLPDGGSAPGKKEKGKAQTPDFSVSEWKQAMEENYGKWEQARQDLEKRMEAKQWNLETLKQEIEEYIRLRDLIREAINKLHDDFKDKDPNDPAIAAARKLLHEYARKFIKDQDDFFLSSHQKGAAGFFEVIFRSRRLVPEDLQEAIDYIDVLGGVTLGSFSNPERIQKKIIQEIESGNKKMLDADPSKVLVLWNSNKETDVDEIFIRYAFLRRMIETRIMKEKQSIKQRDEKIGGAFEFQLSNIEKKYQEKLDEFEEERERLRGNPLPWGVAFKRQFSQWEKSRLALERILSPQTFDKDTDLKKIAGEIVQLRLEAYRALEQLHERTKKLAAEGKVNDKDWEEFKNLAEQFHDRQLRFKKDFKEGRLSQEKIARHGIGPEIKAYLDSIEPLPGEIQILLRVIEHPTLEDSLKDLQLTQKKILDAIKEGKRELIGQIVNNPPSLERSTNDAGVHDISKNEGNELVIRYFSIAGILKGEIEKLEKTLSRKGPEHEPLRERLQALEENFEQTVKEFEEALGKEGARADSFRDFLRDRIVEIVLKILGWAAGIGSVIFLIFRVLRSNRTDRSGSQSPAELGGSETTKNGPLDPSGERRSWFRRDTSGDYGEIINARPGIFGGFKPLILAYFTHLNEEGEWVRQQVVEKSPVPGASPLKRPATKIILEEDVEKDYPLPNYDDGIITDITLERLDGPGIPFVFQRRGDSLTFDEPGKYRIRYEIQHYDPKDIDLHLEEVPLTEKERAAWEEHFGGELRWYLKEANGGIVKAVRNFMKKRTYYAADGEPSLALTHNTWAESLAAVLKESSKCAVVCNQAALIYALAASFLGAQAVYVVEIVPLRTWHWWKRKTVLTRLRDGHAAALIKRSENRRWEYEESVKNLGQRPLRKDLARLKTVVSQIEWKKIGKEIKKIFMEGTPLALNLMSLMLILSFLIQLFLNLAAGIEVLSALILILTNFWFYIFAAALGPSLILVPVFSALHAKMNGLPTGKTIRHNLSFLAFPLIRHWLGAVRNRMRIQRAFKLLGEPAGSAFEREWLLSAASLRNHNMRAALGWQAEPLVRYAYLGRKDFFEKLESWKGLYQYLLQKKKAVYRSRFLKTLFTATEDASDRRWTYEIKDGKDHTYSIFRWLETGKSPPQEWSPVQVFVRPEVSSTVIQAGEKLLRKAVQEETLDRAIPVMEFADELCKSGAGIFILGISEAQAFTARLFRLAEDNLDRAHEIMLYLQEKLEVNKLLMEPVRGSVVFNREDKWVFIFTGKAQSWAVLKWEDREGKWVFAQTHQHIPGSASGETIGLKDPVHGQEVARISLIENSKKVVLRTTFRAEKNQVYFVRKWEGWGMFPRRLYLKLLQNDDPKAAQIFPGRLRGDVEWLVKGGGLKVEPDEDLERDPDLTFVEELIDEEVKGVLGENVSLARLIALSKQPPDFFESPEALESETQPRSESRIGFPKVRKALLREAGEHISIAEMLGAGSSQDSTRWRMLLELIQNARTAILENKEQLIEQGKKLQIRLRSFLTEKIVSEGAGGKPKKKLRWNLVFEDPVGMPDEILLFIFFPPNVSGGMEAFLRLALSRSDPGKRMKAVRQLLKEEFRDNKDLLQKIQETIESETELDIDKMAKRLLAEYKNQFPEFEKVGQFGIGKDTVYVGADEVVVRSGYGREVHRARLPVLRESVHPERMKDIILKSWKRYLDPKGKYQGTRIQWSKEFDEDELEEISYADRNVKNLLAEYVGAVDDVDIVFVDEEGKELRDIVIHDPMFELASYGPRVEVLQSGLGIVRAAMVDRLYAQGSRDSDPILGRYFTDWERRWADQKAAGFNFRLVKPRIQVNTSRTGLVAPGKEVHVATAAMRKAVVHAYRRGEVAIPGLGSYAEFLKDPRLLGPFSDLDPAVLEKVAQDAERINKGEAFTDGEGRSTENETWQRYLENPDQLAALLLQIKALGKGREEISLLEEKRLLFFSHAYVPPWIRELYEENAAFRRAFESEPVKGLPDPLRRPDAFSKYIVYNLYRAAVKLYAAGSIQIPGFPSFESYLKGSEKIPLPKSMESVERDIQNIQSGDLETVDFRHYARDRLEHDAFLLSIRLDSGKSILELNRQMQDQPEEQREAAISSAADVFKGPHNIQKTDNALLEAFDQFLNSIFDALKDALKPEGLRAFRKEIDWELSGADGIILEAFAKFLKGEKEGAAIFGQLLGRLASNPDVRVRNAYYQALLVKNISAFRDRYPVSVDSVDSAFAELGAKIAGQEGRRVLFSYLRSELRSKKTAGLIAAGLAAAAAAIGVVAYQSKPGEEGPGAAAPVEERKEGQEAVPQMGKPIPPKSLELPQGGVIPADTDFIDGLRLAGGKPFAQLERDQAAGSPFRISVKAAGEGWNLWETASPRNLRAAPVLVIRYKSESPFKSQEIYAEFFSVTGDPLVEEATVNNKPKVRLPFEPNTHGEIKTLTVDLEPYLIRKNSRGQNNFPVTDRFALSRPKASNTGGSVTIYNIAFMAKDLPKAVRGPGRRRPDRPLATIFKGLYSATVESADFLGTQQASRLYEKDPVTGLYQVMTMIEGKKGLIWSLAPVISPNGRYLAAIVLKIERNRAGENETGIYIYIWKGKQVIVRRAASPDLEIGFSDERTLYLKTVPPSSINLEEEFAKLQKEPPRSELRRWPEEIRGLKKTNQTLGRKIGAVVADQILVKLRLVPEKKPAEPAEITDRLRMLHSRGVTAEDAAAIIRPVLERRIHRALEAQRKNLNAKQGMIVDRLMGIFPAFADSPSVPQQDLWLAFIEAAGLIAVPLPEGDGISSWAENVRELIQFSIQTPSEEGPFDPRLDSFSQQDMDRAKLFSDLIAALRQKIVLEDRSLPEFASAKQLELARDYLRTLRDTASLKPDLTVRLIVDSEPERRSLARLRDRLIDELQAPEMAKIIRAQIQIINQNARVPFEDSKASLDLVLIPHASRDSLGKFRTRAAFDAGRDLEGNSLEQAAPEARFLAGLASLSEKTVQGLRKIEYEDGVIVKAEEPSALRPFALLARMLAQQAEAGLRAASAA